MARLYYQQDFILVKESGNYYPRRGKPWTDEYLPTELRAYIDNPKYFRIEGSVDQPQIQIESSKVDIEGNKILNNNPSSSLVVKNLTTEAKNTANSTTNPDLIVKK